MRNSCQPETPRAADALPSAELIETNTGPSSWPRVTRSPTTRPVWAISDWTWAELRNSSNPAFAEVANSWNPGISFPVSNFSNASMAGPALSVRASIPSVTASNPEEAWRKKGPARVAPSRPAAAPMLSNEPCTVVPASRAAPPSPVSSAVWKISKETLPAEAIFRASSAVTPISEATICRMGIPASMSWFATSICIISDVATLLIIEPIEDRSVPAIVAASAVSVRVRCSSRPGWMPAATAEAAIVAASARPKEVPFTEARASSMIDVTPWVVCPRPASFDSAFSMPDSRPRPLFRDRARPEPAAAPTPITPALRVVPIPEAIFPPIDLPDLSAVGSAFCRAFEIPGEILETSGTMEI